MSEVISTNQVLDEREASGVTIDQFIEGQKVESIERDSDEIEITFENGRTIKISIDGAYSSSPELKITTTQQVLQTVEKEITL